MTFILDRLKENLSSGDDEGEEEKGFNDMNYIIGESSAMDMGEFPTPMDERIGQASMVGGELMELQITNPATFEMEGEPMIRAIDQLGLDITLHPDMNAGFTSAYKTARGENYGYDAVEQYLTNYMQELAYFKKRVNEQGEGDEPLFNIGRMNPHISTTPMPALAERMAQEVGLDPFGYEIAEFGEGVWKKRDHKGQNIYRNPDFLRKFYKTFVAEELGENEYQYFGNFYTSFSNKFDYMWREKQNDTLQKMYESKTVEKGSETKNKIDLVSTASMRENVSTRWLEILAEDVSKFENSVTVPDPRADDPNDLERDIKNLEDLDKYISEISQRYRLSQLRTLPEIYYFLKSAELSRMARPSFREIAQGLDESGITEELWKQFDKTIPKALDRLWNSDPREENEKEKVSLISVQGKLQAMVREMEIPDNRVQERTFEDNKEDLRDEIAELFAGEEKKYFEDEKDSDDLDWKKKHRRFLQAFGRNLEQEMWKESNLFYKIIPAWMAESSFNEHDGHSGWDSPEFIWEALIEEKWGSHEDVNLDLSKPRNGIYAEDGDDTFHYLDLLEESEEFRSDVAAAVGACYLWAHFTQRKAEFDLKGRDFGLEDDEAEEIRQDGWTWIEWMNRFGLGVNLETMAGSPRDRFKIWRPKDISVAAHAVNLTARNRLEDNGQLGGLDHMHEELDGCPAKFTIDMEHVATMGAPPFDEMKRMVKKEEKLAENWPELNIPEDKPLAKIMRQMHLMDPGVEAKRGTHHGAFDRGNEQLYEWLYYFVENGFARNENEPASVLFELGEHKGESSYMMRITMDLIELGVEPEDLDPSRVDPSTDPDSEEEALIGRFYGIERENYTREWAKIEEHAFDPLSDLLEVEPFENTFSGSKAVEDRKLQEWSSEEYR